MDAIEIILDGGLFSADVVARAAHRYTGDYYAETVGGNRWIPIQPKDQRRHDDGYAFAGIHGIT